MPRGTTLRLPYSVSASSDGELTVSASSDGQLQLDIYNPKTEDILQAGNGNVATITAYEDDYGYDLQFTVLDADDDPFNLTGATVKFQMAKPTASSLKVDESCVIVSATDGQCAYTTQSGDFDTVGEYDAELQITIAGKVYRIGGMTVEVVRKLPRCT